MLVNPEKGMSVSQIRCFEGIQEPRKSNHCHQLTDILFMAGCAVICGADSWDDIELYGKSKQKWLKDLWDNVRFHTTKRLHLNAN